MLEVKHISKAYKDNVILEDINFTIKKGEVISIVGNSGCGKSTILKCLNRLENISSGEILLNGKDITEYKVEELRQKIGLVFQDYNLFEHLTIIDNLTIGLIKIKGYSKESATSEALKLLSKLKLLDKVNNYPDELSGGEKQRIAIARTLLMKPDIILLDEPTSALDKSMKREVLKLIGNLVKEDLTLIIVSHEDDFVHKVSDKIITIKNKKSKITINKEKTNEYK